MNRDVIYIYNLQKILQEIVWRALGYAAQIKALPKKVTTVCDQIKERGSSGVFFYFMKGRFNPKMS